MKADVTVTDEASKPMHQGLYKHNKDTYKANVEGAPNQKPKLNVEIESQQGERVVATGINYDFEKGEMLTDRKISQQAGVSRTISKTDHRIGWKDYTVSRLGRKGCAKPDHETWGSSNHNPRHQPRKRTQAGGHL